MNWLERTLVIDFETVWDAEYTLSKMTTEAYIRDPRFHAYGASVKQYGDAHPPRWVPHNKLRRLFASVDWSQTAVLAHNAVFDVSIMAFVYGVQPAYIFD
jgi:hypothetical protein